MGFGDSDVLIQLIQLIQLINVFINYNQWISLIGAWGAAVCVHVWGQGAYGNSLYLLLSFAVSLIWALGIYQG